MSSDPTTDEIEIVKASLAKVEAMPKPAARSRKVEPVADATFVSKEAEVHEFEVMEIRPTRRPDRRLVWVVPSDLTARFEVHHHVQRGRIVRSDANV
jgi:hypothetical protein